MNKNIISQLTEMCELLIKAQWFEIHEGQNFIFQPNYF